MGREAKNSEPKNGVTQMTGKSICNGGVCMEKRRGHGKKFIALATVERAGATILVPIEVKFSGEQLDGLDIEVDTRPG